MSDHGRNGHHHHADAGGGRSASSFRPLHRHHRSSRQASGRPQRGRSSGYLEGLILLVILLLLAFAYGVGWLDRFCGLHSGIQYDGIELPGQLPTDMPPLKTAR